MAVHVDTVAHLTAQLEELAAENEAVRAEYDKVRRRRWHWALGGFRWIAR